MLRTRSISIRSSLTAASRTASASSLLGRSHPTMALCAQVIKPSRVAFSSSVSLSSSASSSSCSSWASSLSSVCCASLSFGGRSLRSTLAPQLIPSTSAFHPSLLCPVAATSPFSQSVLFRSSGASSFTSRYSLCHSRIDGSTVETVDPFSSSPCFTTRKSHGVWNPAVPLWSQLDRRCNSNFIRHVMEQVKKEMETNEQLRESVKQLKESKMTESSSELRDKMGRTGDKIQQASQRLREKAVRHYGIACGVVSRLQSEASKGYAVYRQYKEGSAMLTSLSDSVHRIRQLTASSISWIVQGTNRALNIFKDEKAEEAKLRVQRWRESMEKQRGGEGQEEDQGVASSNSPSDSESQSEQQQQTTEETYALIVSQDSAWDRFGTKLRDMPFLHNFFENPLISQLLGETSQAAALREMKVLDPSFRLPDLVDLTEHVIAPHLVHAFLNGDRDALNIQCGEAAFGAINHSIKERETLKLSLDPTVLLLRNVEFKGGSPVQDQTPWFIFTFTAQQINCMRDKEGNVIVGAIDDIREVVYTVALTRHPHPEHPGLSYPWQVTEFAMIGNTPCW